MFGLTNEIAKPFFTATATVGALKAKTSQVKADADAGCRNLEEHNMKEEFRAKKFDEWLEMA